MKQRNRQARGHAIVEFSLMAPWIFFLFVGALDFGFFAHALISTQNAARIAALATAATYTGSGTPNQQVACDYARQEMQRMPNSDKFTATCSSVPLRVASEAALNGAGPMDVRVTVTYDTVLLVPIPGLLTGQLTIVRAATVPSLGELP